MGDAEKTRRRARRSRPAGLRPAAAAWVALLLGLAALAPGCRSSRPVPAEPMPPAPAAAEPAPEADASGEAQPEALEVTGIEVREGAPGALVEITSSEPLVWTSFRDAEGRVVVELPNAVPAAGVSDLEPDDGLVDRIAVSREQPGRRPLTRLVIATREEVEHTLRADGRRLVIELEPLAPAAAAPVAEEELAEEGADELAFEPLREEERPAAPPAPAEPAPEPRPVQGTPDEPRRGPAPTGTAASRLSAVTVESAPGLTVVEIRGDGEFAYSTFHLSAPERFVIDLDGVVNRAERSAIPVASGPVERVRLAQFQPFPEPVSRVVLDLREAGKPQLERTPDSLVVRLRSGPQSPTPVPEPAATPPVVVEEPTDAEDVPAATPRGTAQDVEITEVPAEVPPPPAEPPPPPDSPPPAQVIQVEEAPAAEPPPPAAEAPAPAGPPPSDASLFEATEIRMGEEGAAGEEGLFFGTRQVGGEREYFGEPIDMSLKDADVVETLRSFAEISGLNIVVQPEVSGRVTVELKNVPWDQALEQILKINNLGYDVEGTIMRIAPLDMLRQEAQQRQQLAAAQALSVPLETVMKRLSYTSAAGIAAILQRGGGAGGILSQRASIIVDQRTNTLIISELPEYMDTVLAIIENLDEPEPQVMIEARIIETTKRFSRELGVSWGFDFTAGTATGNTTGLQFPNNVDTSGAVELATAGQNAVLDISLGNILNTFQLDAALNAAEEDGLVNILSTPKVTTLNNHQATIQSGLQIPIQTVANNTVTVQFVNATLRLDVTPQITADGTVVMDIHIQKREVQQAFLTPGAQGAPIATKEAQTQVLVRDGGTAVIGGIYEVSTDQSQQRVPGLANVPILGHLFRNRSRTDENEELLIFITPRVVRL